jgi:hypothetical protein
LATIAIVRACAACCGLALESFVGDLALDDGITIR